MRWDLGISLGSDALVDTGRKYVLFVIFLNFNDVRTRQRALITSRMWLIPFSSVTSWHWTSSWISGYSHLSDSNFCHSPLTEFTVDRKIHYVKSLEIVWISLSLWCQIGIRISQRERMIWDFLHFCEHDGGRIIYRKKEKYKGNKSKLKAHPMSKLLLQKLK